MTNDFFNADASTVADTASKGQSVDPFKVIEVFGGVALDALDDAKRRQFEKSFRAMDDAQQEEFKNKMLAAQTMQGKLQLITQAILEQRRAELESSSNKMRNVALIVIGSGVLLIGVAALLKARK